MTHPSPRTALRRAARTGAAPRPAVSSGRAQGAPGLAVSRGGRGVPSRAMAGGGRGVWRRSVGVLAVVVVAGMLAACGPEQSGAGSQPPSSGASQSRRIAGADKLAACPSTPSRPPVAKSLPDISLPCLGNGPDVRLSALRGPLVVNVWAQWCGPCREEAPYLAELNKKAGDKVQLIGIDYADPRPELAVKFATEQQWDYPHVVDADKTTQQALRIAGPPLTAFVDKDGAVVYVHRGELTSQQQLDRLVREKLGVTW